MDDLRFSKLENRVDEIKDDLSDVKIEQRINGSLLIDLRDDFKEHRQVMSDHITGDNKIISHIEPLLIDLKEVVDNYKFQKEQKKRKVAAIKDWSIKLTVTSTIIGIVYKFIDYLVS